MKIVNERSLASPKMDFSKFKAFNKPGLQFSLLDLKVALVLWLQPPVGIFTPDIITKLP
jgi:hypothetical protein